MKHPDTGEKALPLTRAQVDTLSELYVCHPAPHFIPNLHTAVALLNRGFVSRVQDGSEVGAKSLYNLTQRGRVALRIGARERW